MNKENKKINKNKTKWNVDSHKRKTPTTIKTVKIKITAQLHKQKQTLKTHFRFPFYWLIFL